MASVGLSPYLANNWLNLLRGVAFTAPSGVYAKLHTGIPGAAGTANASVVTTRLQVSYSAASSGTISLTGTPPQFNMTATETLTHVSFWDAATGGNFLWSAPLTTSKTVGNGDTYTLSSNTVTLAALASD